MFFSSGITCESINKTRIFEIHNTVTLDMKIQIWEREGRKKNELNKKYMFGPLRIGSIYFECYSSVAWLMIYNKPKKGIKMWYICKNVIAKEILHVIYQYFGWWISHHFILSTLLRMIVCLNNVRKFCFEKVVLLDFFNLLDVTIYHIT